MDETGSIDPDALRRRLHPEEESPAKKKSEMVKIAIGAGVLLLILIGVAVLIKPEDAAGTPKACFKHDVCIDLILATTEEAQEIGLSNYTSLPQGTGMLFIFDRPDIQRMWMKDMDFPIDIMWISDKGRILHIEKKAMPCESGLCEIFEPNVLAKYVLETNEGFAIDSNLFNTDQVEFSDLPR